MIKKLVSFAFLLSSFLVQSQELKDLIKEDFSTNDRSWRTTDFGAYDARVVDGYYYITNKTDGAEGVWTYLDEEDISNLEMYMIAAQFAVRPQGDATTAFFTGVYLMNNDYKYSDFRPEEHKGAVIGVTRDNGKYWLYVKVRKKGKVALIAPIDKAVLNKDVILKILVSNVDKQILIYLNDVQYGALPFGLYDLQKVGFYLKGKAALRAKGIAVRLYKGKVDSPYDMFDYYFDGKKNMIFRRGWEFSKSINKLVPEFLMRDDLEHLSQEQISNLLKEDSSISRIDSKSLTNGFVYRFFYKEELDVELIKRGSAFRAELIFEDDEKRKEFTETYTDIKDMELIYPDTKSEYRLYYWKGTDKGVEDANVKGSTVIIHYSK
ncbi:hypothetical protein [Myroides pelagicus]|uniref:Uncharacterized protein n=1 Tax=Myroides pelagicus TaxID=270914 RepID=A0A7K1GRU5_9FLAO|nr:hypothetical protein [Myroides pelagicus]MTH31079.1 hypothetical protein [Myroides pelagicus]